MHAIATININELPHDVDALLEVIVEQRRQFGAALESLRQQLAKLKQMTFGSRSDRFAGQALLFTEALPIPPAPPKPHLTQVAAHERTRRGCPALPADLPRAQGLRPHGQAEGAF